MFYDIYVSSDTTKGSIECVSILTEGVCFKWVELRVM